MRRRRRVTVGAALMAWVAVAGLSGLATPVVSAATPGSAATTATAPASVASGAAGRAHTPPGSRGPGTARPFSVHVPPGYKSTSPAPLLILLHGYGATGAIQESYLGLTPQADAHGMLYVHPDGTVDQSGKRFWNATDACCDLFGTGVDDSGYLSGVISQVEAQYNVDRRRIFIVGHSNGAFMAYRMACDHADQVAAVVSFEGATYSDPSKCHPSEPVATLEMHGTSDQTISYNGGSIGGHPYPGAAATALAWAAADGCTATADNPAPSPHQIEQGPAATVTSYSTGCTAPGHAELWTQSGGAHIPQLSPTFAAQVVGYLLAHPKIGVSATNGSVLRPASGTVPLTFTVGLTHTRTTAVSVHFQTVDGTAIGLVDFTPTAGTATIAAGQTSTTVSVPVIGNQSDEPAKTFTLQLSAGVHAVAYGAPAVGTILPNHLLAGCPPSPTANQRYVCHIYWDALGRAAEHGGFTYWVGQLDHGTPRITMATSYLNQNESRRVLVDRLYVFFLGRHGDASGVGFWADKLLHGATPDDVRVFLATSNEFWTKAGATNRGFVTRLFANVFRRPVDSGGLSYWTAKLDQGATRASVVNAFLFSSEGRSHIVGDVYLRFLRRYPTAAESSALVNQLTHGTTEIAIYDQTVAGTEYYQRP